MGGWDIAKIAAVCGVVQLLFAFILRPAVLWGLDQRYAAKKETEAIEGLFVRADDRWGEVESRVQTLEHKTQHEWALISQRMEHTAKTLDDATKRLATISDDHIRLMTEWGIRNNPDGIRRTTSGQQGEGR